MVQLWLYDPGTFLNFTSWFDAFCSEFWRQTVKPCPHCRRKVRLSHKSETVSQKWNCLTFVRLSHFSAIVWTGHDTSTSIHQLELKWRPLHECTTWCGPWTRGILWSCLLRTIQSENKTEHRPSINFCWQAWATSSWFMLLCKTSGWELCSDDPHLELEIQSFIFVNSLLAITRTQHGELRVISD